MKSIHPFKSYWTETKSVTTTPTPPATTTPDDDDADGHEKQKQKKNKQKNTGPYNPYNLSYPYRHPSLLCLNFIKGYNSTETFWQAKHRPKTDIS